MYAFVRFFEDDVCCALPVSSIPNFSPEHGADFDHRKVYVVRRTEENGSAGQLCQAHILALAGKFLHFHFFDIPALYFSLISPHEGVDVCRNMDMCQVM